VVYEGTNFCIGFTGTSHPDSKFYSTIGIATSADFGHSWPTYKANFTPLPGTNPSQGPMAPLGAWGGSVCWGNFCPSIGLPQPPSRYGRYAVSGPATSIQQAMQEFQGGLTADMGDSEPAALVDEVRPGTPVYVYITHNYATGPFPQDTPLPSGGGTDLSVSRVLLNASAQRLQATHWYQGKFTEPGLAADGDGLSDQEHWSVPSEVSGILDRHWPEPVCQWGIPGRLVSLSDVAWRKTGSPHYRGVCFLPEGLRRCPRAHILDAGFHHSLELVSMSDLHGPDETTWTGQCYAKSGKSWASFQRRGDESS